MSLNNYSYTFKQYFSHRFVRIYSVIIVSWVVSFLSYYIVKGIPDFNSAHLLGNIFMLQDLAGIKEGLVTTPFLGNDPLWSLSYEWWYYMFFFFHLAIANKYLSNRLFLFNSSGLVISAIGLAIYALLPNQISLFMSYYYIWFTGAIISLYVMKREFNKDAIRKILFSYIILFIICFFFYQYFNDVKFFGLALRYYIASFIELFVAIIFSIYFFKRLANKKIYIITITLLSKFAKISFAVYVLHFPIRNIYMSIDNVNNYILFLATILTTVIIGYFSEIKFYGYLKRKLL